MENLYYEDHEALRRALLCVSIILVERIMLLVDGKQQTSLGKRYADLVEADCRGDRLLGHSTKLLVHYRLDYGLMCKGQSRLKRSIASEFKFSDLVQIFKIGGQIGFGARRRIRIKTPRDER